MLWLAGASCAVAMLAVGCNGENGAEAGRAGAPGGRPQALHVKTVSVQRMSVQRKVDIVGTLLSPDQAKVSSEVAGVVREVLAELGQEVKPGQILIRLEPRELALALERAESALRQTEAQLEIDPAGGQPPPDEQVASVRTAIATRDDVRAQMERASRLVSSGLLPQVELENVQTRMKVADAAYQAALNNVRSLKASLQDRRATHELAQKKLDDAVIRAPVAGSIAERIIHAGEFIRENTPVVTIVQMNPLKLRTAVQERYAEIIKPGLPVQFSVESLPGIDFSGKIAYISPSVEPATRTFAVEALVNNADRRLKPGFFAKGAIVTQRDEEVRAVPDAAVSTLAGVSTVFVVEDNKVRRQTVTVGVRQDGMYEIVEGLKGDEMLASSNLSQLSNGLTVAAGPPSEGRLVSDPSGAASPQQDRAPGANGPGGGARANGDRGDRP